MRHRFFFKWSPALVGHYRLRNEEVAHIIIKFGPFNRSGSNLELQAHQQLTRNMFNHSRSDFLGLLLALHYPHRQI
jgi:hypothetical protein